MSRSKGRIQATLVMSVSMSMIFFCQPCIVEGFQLTLEILKQVSVKIAMPLGTETN